MASLGFEDSDAKSLLFFEPCVQSWDKSYWTALGSSIERDLRHAPLTSKESGCNANTKTVSTPREKLQEQVGDRQSPILEKEHAKRYRSACMRLSSWAQDRLDLVDTAKHLAQRNEQTTRIRHCSAEACSEVSC